MTSVGSLTPTVTSWRLELLLPHYQMAIFMDRLTSNVCAVAQHDALENDSGGP